MDHASSNCTVDDVNPYYVEKYLRGLSYPAHKKDAIYAAMSNGAPDEIVQALSDIHERDRRGNFKEFYNDSDVITAIP